MKHLNGLLKRARIAVGMTQAGLATKLGIHPQNIHNYETGRSPVPAKHINKLLRILKVDTAEAHRTYLQDCSDAFRKIVKIE